MSVSQENEFRITANVDHVNTFSAKSGKEIVTIVLAIDDRWQTRIPIKVFGRVADDAKSLKPGTIVRVIGRLGGRDFNGRVYGDNVAERIEVVSDAEKHPDLPGAVPIGQADPSDSTPF